MKARRKSGSKRNSDYFCGYLNYTEYLAGDLWSSIRGRKLAITPLCELCNSKALQVHHFAYSKKILKGNDIEALVSICRDCHHYVEFTDSKKLSLREAQLKLIKKLEADGKTERINQLLRYSKNMKLREYGWNCKEITLPREVRKKPWRQVFHKRNERPILAPVSAVGRFTGDRPGSPLGAFAKQMEAGALNEAMNHLRSESKRLSEKKRPPKKPRF